jgi:hypothetical protein
MNRTIKEAAVKRYHDEDHAQFRQHLDHFIAADTFGRRLKTLKGLTPYEFICKQWTKQPERFRFNPTHQMPGLNSKSRRSGRNWSGWFGRGARARRWCAGRGLFLRRRRIGDEEIADLVRRTLKTKPSNATHWSLCKMATTADHAPSTIHRIWKAFGLQPHGSEIFQLPADPLFVEKPRDIVGVLSRSTPARPGPMRR